MREREQERKDIRQKVSRIDVVRSEERKKACEEGGGRERKRERLWERGKNGNA